MSFHHSGARRAYHGIIICICHGAFDYCIYCTFDINTNTFALYSTS